MKLKKLIAALSVCALMTGCAQSAPSAGEDTEPEKFNLSEVYTELSEENHFDEADRETLTSILEHGTAALFLGFPECPWCQVYVPMLEEVIAGQEMLCSYYNIFADKKTDREFYDQIADLLISQNDTGEDIVQYDNDGKKVIYMPLTLFVEEGRIVAFDNETCTEDASVISPEDYWTAEKISALKEKLTGFAAEVAELQEANNSKGCASGCKVGD